MAAPESRSAYDAYDMRQGLTRGRSAGPSSGRVAREAMAQEGAIPAAER